MNHWLSEMDILAKYFPHLETDQINRLDRLPSLYSYWNERINVISRKDMDNLILHHVLHSLAVARIFQPIPGTRILDAGTGGGFPGIPLAILFPKVEFLLIDSIAKKIRVTEAIRVELGLTNCVCQVGRVEKLVNPVDFVVSRAVTSLPELWHWVRKNIIPGGANTIPNGLLVFKGDTIREELIKVKEKPIIFRLSDYFDEPFFETKLLVHIAR